MTDVAMYQWTLNVRREQCGRAVHLHVGGELDMATLPILEAWLAGAESNGNTAIILDLDNLTFMDASGLRAFLRAAERATRRGRRFAIVNARPGVRRVLEITRTAFLLAPENNPVLERELDGGRPGTGTVDGGRSAVTEPAA